MSQADKVIITCSSCNARIGVPSDVIGQRIRCPKCKAVINTNVEERPLIQAAPEPPPVRRIPPPPAEKPRAEAKKPPGLLAKVTCPHCWHTFPPHETKWVSAHPSLRDDPKVPEGGRRFLPTRFSVSGQAIDSKGELCTDLACPHCHLTLPRDVIELPLAIFSILGAPSSGKSYYLASSLWQLRTTLATRFGISFEDSDPVANQKLHQYEETLFLSAGHDKLVALPKTELDGDLYEQIEIEPGRVVQLPRPFIFRMSLLPDHPKAEMIRKNGRSICMYDNAGEHFLPGAQTANSPGTRHMLVSKALLFVFDPTQHTQIRKLCFGKTDDPQVTSEVSSYRQDLVLSEATRRIRAETGLQSGQRDHRPLIVILTKYDVWRAAVKGPSLNADTILQKIETGLCEFNVSQLKSISAMFRSVLTKVAPEIVSTAEAFSEDVTYIPVSALGCSPESIPGTAAEGGSRMSLGIRPKDIQPIWSEVPLLYAMHRSIPGFLPVT
ncbi:MAG: hypothetical protein JNL58_23590 [Planctomyces sp.]|nr:hypothetical protein [Planctomyces sp.]